MYGCNGSVLKQKFCQDAAGIAGFPRKTPRPFWPNESTCQEHALSRVACRAQQQAEGADRRGSDPTPASFAEVLALHCAFGSGRRSRLALGPLQCRLGRCKSPNMKACLHHIWPNTLILEWGAPELHPLHTSAAGHQQVKRPEFWSQLRPDVTGTSCVLQAFGALLQGSEAVSRVSS